MAPRQTLTLVESWRGDDGWLNEREKRMFPPQKNEVRQYIFRYTGTDGQRRILPIGSVKVDFARTASIQALKEDGYAASGVLSYVNPDDPHIEIDIETISLSQKGKA